MKKLILSLMLTILLNAGLAERAAAFDPSLNFAIGSGHVDSVTFDLWLQQTYGTWFSGDSWTVRPLTTQGVTFWHDPDESEAVVGLLASIGVVLNYYGETVQPYVMINAGPSIISETYFADRHLGGHFIFNTRVMGGLRFGENFRHNLSVHATHYSNAYIYEDNDGFNTVGLAYGYTF